MTKMMIDVRLSEWANYVAQDVNGDWWQYSNKPKEGQGFWITEEGKSEFIAAGTMPANWKKKIHEVNRE